ncbi:MAG TPA: WD40 repeat domain-containing protein [Anaerolineales bacterium]|nr:WD40 repeat domain-containing protein [Anaerolineales bacterium]
MVQLRLEFEAHSNYALPVLFPGRVDELVTAGMDRMIRHWKLPELPEAGSPQLIREVVAHANSVNSLAFTPDRRSLLSASTDASICIWSWPDLQLIHTLSGHKKTVAGLAVAPGGSLAASASYDSQVMLWNIPTGELSGILKGHRRNVTCVAFSPDGRTLASSGLGEDICIWDIPSQTIQKKLPGHKDAVGTLAYTPDGRYLLSIDNAGVLRLWAAAGLQLKREIQLPKSRMGSFAFHPNGEICAIGAEHRILLGEWLSGEIIAEIPFKPSAVAGISFSPDGKSLAAGFADRKVRLWDLGSTVG